MKHRYCQLILLLVLFQSFGVSALEPSICKMLVSEAEKQNESLVDWQLENNIELKKQGCWKIQLHYGRQAILQAIKEQRYLAKAQIELQLSSSEFFLGNYTESLELAESAQAFAKQHSRWREYIESLYLLSGIYRGLDNDDAITFGKKALEMLEQHRIDDNFLRAKIHYNLGAAYSDSNTSSRDLNKAEQSFRKAFQIFSSQNNHYEMVRVGLRLARVEYLRQNYIKALIEIETVENHIHGPRSRMLYHYQLGKVLLKMGRYRAAVTEAEKALELADRLHATVDRSRIAKLIKKAEDFQPSSGKK